MIPVLKRAAYGLIVLVLLFNTSCFNNKGPNKGSALFGDDALKFLAGKEEQCWKLTAGEDFMKMMCFSKGGSFRDHTNYKMTFALDGSKITIKDYKDLVYTIYEITDKQLILVTENNVVLIYIPTTERPKDVPRTEEANAKPEQKWLAGASYGSIWKGETSDYTYTFMNDGRFFDSNTGYKQESWRWVDENTINIGSIDCEVIKLTAVYFTIKMGGTEIRLKYQGEAAEDGKPQDNDQDTTNAM